MILEPLGILTDGLSAVSGFFIDIFYQTFPRTLDSKWIAVDLDETIDEVDSRIVLFKPFNRIFIELL